MDIGYCELEGAIISLRKNIDFYEVAWVISLFNSVT